MAKPATRLIPDGGSIPINATYEMSFVYVPAVDGDPANIGVKFTHDAGKNLTVQPLEGTTDDKGVIHFSVSCSVNAPATDINFSVLQVGKDGPGNDGDEIISGVYKPAQIKIGSVLVSPPYQVVAGDVDKALTTFVKAFATPRTGAASAPVPSYNIGFDIKGNFVASDSDTSDIIEPVGEDDPRFYTVSGTDGTGVINVGAITSGIFPVRAGVGSGNHVSPDSYMVFIPGPGEGGGDKLPLIIEGEYDGQLDMDKLKTAYVTVYADSRIINPNERGHLNALSQVVVVVNDKVVGVPVPLESLIEGLQLPKSVFKTGGQDNDLYWMSSDVFSMNPSFSNVITVNVTGNGQNNPPDKGTYPAPKGPIGIFIINDEVLALGDLVFSVPKYTGMAQGDVVTLQAYINAYETKTGVPRSGIVNAKDVTVSDPSVYTLSATIAAADLVGYNASQTGLVGTVDVLYTVKSLLGETKGYSRILTPSLRIATT